MAVFSRIAPSLVSAYGLQTLLALIFVPQQNEMYYDLGGALGYLSTTFVSLYYPALKAKYIDGVPGPLPSLSSFSARQLLLSGAVGLWSSRLGMFLVLRALKAGGDRRFDAIKKNPKLFFFVWMMQATWISVVGMPAFLTNTLPADLHPALTRRDYAAAVLFAVSFLVEVIADRQKSAWRAAKDAGKHAEKFISSGLWSISRHPNYVGEVGIWTALWALSTGSLNTPHFPRGTVALAALSPIFTWYLTAKVRGP
ncbi:hypothetical protein H0H81_002710 [Sphagnurus paluster]|uniref:Steroid 5-alpha reductase C-terminal domain-containing protein n=1 Tax=Sphagnurus paluster TaxID=117069 RepID=A0A9P7GTU5_9AGAR|nr:hypothetical protein H0H81_002710 [Sphagnurus paluster]